MKFSVVNNYAYIFSFCCYSGANVGENIPSLYWWIEHLILFWIALEFSKEIIFFEKFVEVYRISREKPNKWKFFKWGIYQWSIWFSSNWLWNSWKKLFLKASDIFSFPEKFVKVDMCYYFNFFFIWFEKKKSINVCTPPTWRYFMETGVQAPNLSVSQFSFQISQIRWAPMVQIQ